MNKKPALVLSVAGLLMISATLRAHHSDAVYDMTRLQIIRGSVIEHQLVNPHQLIRVKVTDADGKVMPWTLVGDAVLANRTIGWTKETLKPGDEITVWGFPYRDGKPNMTWMRIVMASGKMLPMPGGAKADKLARYLGTYGKKQLSPEDYEVFKESLKNNPRISREGLSLIN